ncbi:MAG: hypothetical protein GXP43_00060 [bacterium]|nr:hypothetical protein [bacterium]
MILEQNQAEELVEIFKSAKNIGVCVADQPLVDEVLLAAGLGLSLNIEGKKSWFGGNYKIDLNFPHKEAVKGNAGNRDLVITLPYKEAEVDRIATQTVDGRMRIVVEPKNEVDLMDENQVEISYQGLRVDLIILVGTKQLSDLGEVYNQNRLVFQEVPLIHLHKPAVVGLGKINFEIRKAKGVVEVVEMLKKLGMKPNTQGLDVLMWSLRYATGNFRPPITAEVLEAASWLIKQGAVDMEVKQAQKIGQVWKSGSWGMPPMPTGLPINTQPENIQQGAKPISTK